MWRWASLAIAAALAACAPAAGDAVCGGTPVPIVQVPGGYAPHASYEAGGESGAFLIDYGATQSSLDRSRYPGFASPLTTGFSLPSFGQGTFILRDYGDLIAPPGGRLGIIGTDFLSLLSAAFDFRAGTVVFSPEPCPEAALAADGWLPVAQTGHFSASTASLSGVNVPVLHLSVGGAAPLRFVAQIDSGYDDTVYPHSIDVNAALFAALREAGVAMARAGSVRVVTCAGAESREVWRLEGPVTVLAGDSEVRRIADVHIIPKAPNACGGIAGKAQPMGQIGASILHDLGEVIFDPRNARVWLRRRD